MVRRYAAKAVLLLALAAGCDGLPDLAQEHVRQGDLALAEGRYAEALTAYGHAHELAPHDARVQKAQMRARVHLMADSPARVGAEALDDIAYEAALLQKIDKGREAVCLTAIGNVLGRRGDIDGAKAKLTEAVKADPSSAIAHSALGALLMRRREGVGSARVEFELALKVKPDARAALLGLGQLKLAEGDWAGAVERLEVALRQGDDLPARMALGNARLQQGKHAEAADQFRRAVDLDPRSADALSSLGQALLGAGRLEEAEATLRAATELRREESTSVALGFTLERLKKPDQALGVFGQVLAADANAASALYGAGIASEDLGRTDQALDYYRRVLALAADGPQKQLVSELKRQAQGRVGALSPAPSASASASASAPPASSAGPGKRR